MTVRTCEDIINGLYVSENRFVTKETKFQPSLLDSKTRRISISLCHDKRRNDDDDDVATNALVR